MEKYYSIHVNCPLCGYPLVVTMTQLIGASPPAGRIVCSNCQEKYRPATIFIYDHRVADILKEKDSDVDNRVDVHLYYGYRKKTGKTKDDA